MRRPFSSGPTQPTSLDKEASQLWLTAADSSRVTMCTAYASDEAKRAFLRAIFEFVR